MNKNNVYYYIPKMALWFTIINIKKGEKMTVQELYDFAKERNILDSNQFQSLVNHPYIPTEIKLEKKLVCPYLMLLI